MSYKVIRSHEICAGHRVVGHESKCRHLHGHNYVFHFHVAPKMKTVKHGEPGYNLIVNDRTKLDDVGRVIDFSVVKSSLCEWLENNWDHKFLHWEHDELIDGIKQLVGKDQLHNTDVHVDQVNGLPAQISLIGQKDKLDFFSSFVELPFNPTAENLAAHMVNVIGPELLDPYGVELVQCVIEETSKCHVEYTK